MADLEDIARNIDRAYMHLMDSDLYGRQKARRLLNSALEDLCDEDECDLEQVYVALGAVEEKRALVTFAAQAVAELRIAGFDIEEAIKREIEANEGEGG